MLEQVKNNIVTTFSFPVSLGKRVFNLFRAEIDYSNRFDAAVYKRLIENRPKYIKRTDWKKRIDFLNSSLSKLEGWFSPLQCAELFLQIVSSVQTNSKIVEIGSWKGRSSVFASHAAYLSHSKLYCVDTFKGNRGEGEQHATVIEALKSNIFEQFQKNIQTFGCPNVVVCRGESSVIARNWDLGQIDFLFIDGSHDYESVIQDLSSWVPLLRPGGVVCGDDWNIEEIPHLNGSVRQAFNDFFKREKPSEGIFERFWIHRLSC